jgi:predicted O-methyltransferase YrrM
VAIDDLVPAGVNIQIREPIDVDGNATVLEIAVIAKLVRLHDPRSLFEIGTFDGRTTLNMAANCADEAKVYTLDLPADQLTAAALPLAAGDRRYIEKSASGSRYVGTDCEGKIVQLYGDSATFDFSPYWNAVDFVFIDGSHSYDYVLSDTERALKLLRNRRGVILWHDYGSWDDVTTALNGLYASGHDFRGLRRIEGTTIVVLVLT